MTKQLSLSYAVLFVVLCINIAVWMPLKNQRATWLNVPPAASDFSASVIGFGDKQFAYRALSIVIQNLGDSGGRVVSLTDYNYDRLGDWFFMLSRLDPKSNFVPMMAAYYFGSTSDSSQLTPLIAYLEHVGTSVEGEKWRWLAQAAYLARFGQDDLDEALRLAHKLAALDIPNMPIWAAQMPAFVSIQRGEKEAALEMMMALLREEQDNMHPNEINFVAHTICHRLLEPDQWEGYPFCKDTK